MLRNISFGASNWIIALIVCGMRPCEGNPSCFSSSWTDGKFLVAKEENYYNSQPIITISNSTAMKCSMILIANIKAQGMNVVDEKHNEVMCEIFESKYGYGLQDDKLMKKEGSIYYEKLERILKATPSVIVVGSKDEKPGTFNFELPTGYYRIRLNHMYGGFICAQSQPIRMTFGCYFSVIMPQQVILVNGFRGTKVVPRYKFNEYEGDGINTKYLATSDCFYLVEGSLYSFWYLQDYRDTSELDNSGETAFEMVVQSCENSNGCV